MSVESYAHKAAKQVVVSWLRNAARRPQDYVSECGCYWKVNRPGPHFGIWEEYPVLPDRTGFDPVWDEFSFDPPTGPTFHEGPPSYEYLKNIGKCPSAILDVAVQHKGAIAIGIEIVHKSPPRHEKLIFLKTAGLHSLLVLPARWVLGQIAPPPHVPPEFWFWSEAYFRADK